MFILIGVVVALVAILVYVWSQKSTLIGELEDEKRDLTEQMENLQSDYASLSSDYDSINSQLDTSRAEVAKPYRKDKEDGCHQQGEDASVREGTRNIEKHHA